jgi:hypothetical protein
MMARSRKPNRDQTVHHGALDPASSPRALHPEPLVLRTSNGATEAVISRTKSAIRTPRSVRDIPARSLVGAMVDRSYEDDNAYRRRPGNQDQTKY